MDERNSGSIIIVAGMSEAKAPAVDKHATVDRKHELALRLRKQGWSYRRIAGALSVSYIRVQYWMEMPPGETTLPVEDDRIDSGEVVPSLPVPRANPNPGPAPLPVPVKAAAVPAVPDTDSLTKRLDALARGQQDQAAALAALERRLLGAIEAETKTWGQRILKAIKGLYPWGRSGDSE